MGYTYSLWHGVQEHKTFTKRIFAGVMALLFAGSIAAAMSASASTSQAVYDSTPEPLPSSTPSIGYQATQTAELGAKIEFAAGERKFDNATVVLNSWACESGSWNGGDCLTTEGATYDHEVTLNVYGVETDGTLGETLTSVTQTVAVPYRPSADSACGDGRWMDANNTCNNGYNFTAVFDLNGVELPDQVVYGVAYNTMTWGYAPEGVTGAYDALNFSVVSPANVTTGTPLETFRASGANPVFQADATYATYTPVVQFNTVVPKPVSKDDCKKGGYEAFSFKNQGQCVASVVSNENSAVRGRN